MRNGLIALVLFFMIIQANMSCTKVEDYYSNLATTPQFNSLQVIMNKSGLTPLAGNINYTSDQNVKISYTVKGQDGVDFNHGKDSLLAKGEDYLFALYPNYKNQIKFTITNSAGYSRDSIVYISTPKLSSSLLDQSNIIVNSPSTNNAKTNFILLYVVKTLNSAFLQDPITQKPIIIDKFGKIRGFLDITDVLEMKPLPNGHFLYYKSNNFNEIDLLGNVFHTITPPNPCHHDFEILPNGNILYTGEDQSINQTMEDKIYEIDYQTGNIVNTINLFNVFDPARQTLPSTVDIDWLHNNSLCYDKTDNSLLLTARNQSLIAKIDMNSKKLFWMISDSSYWNTNLKPFLLKPIGSNFEFAYGEHSVRTSPYDHNKIIVFDNGNARSYTQPLTLAQSYSRLVEYTIDPITQQVSQSFDFGKQLGAATYTNATGNVDYLTQDNFLINFGFIIKDVNGNVAPDGATSMRLMEVNRQGNVNMDITIKNTDPNTPLNGFRSYRAHPISFF